MPAANVIAPSGDADSGQRYTNIAESHAEVGKSIRLIIASPVRLARDA